MIIGQNRRITAMHDFIDLNRYPLDQPESVPWQALVATCQENLAQDGLFNLSGFVPRDALGPVVAALPPVLDQRHLPTRERTFDHHQLKAFGGAWKVSVKAGDCNSSVPRQRLHGRQ